MKYCCQKAKKQIKISKKFKVGLSLILSGLLMLLILADGIVRDVISGYPMNFSAGIITKLMDTAMDEVLKNENISPNDIDNVIYDKNGNVLSIETDTTKLLKIKTDYTEKLISDIREYGDIITISVPIGTIIGNEYTIGRGPKISFDLQFTCTVSTDLKSNFIATGVNNTLHTMELYVTTNIYIIIPWGHNCKSVTTKYILSETVIVGDVPEAFTNINGANDEITDDIVDHGAEIS